MSTIESSDYCYDLSEEAKADKQYVVEKVLARRLNCNGKWEYLINWVGFSTKDNTWEAKDDIHPDLIADFEREQVESDVSVKKKKNISNDISLSRKELLGVQKGWRVRAVIGAKKQKDSSILYAVDYVQGSPLLREYIPSEIAQIYIPHKIIEFFQNITVWNSSNKVN